MIDQPAHTVSPPETGSDGGVHLHEGVFADRDGLAPPSAFLGGALYSIYPRAFSAEGTLRAILPHLDRIVALGASALWLLPVHPIGNRGRKGSRGSPYAVRDYRAVHPDLGTQEDLAALVEASHERGLRVLIDLVANHAANDHVDAERSPSWFARNGAGDPARRYHDWSDIADWRFSEPGVSDYLRESALHWVEETGIDGFRCDVAGMVPLSFWRELHEALEAVRPEHFMLAEWQDPEHHTVAFHASYDWLLYRALRDTAQGRASASAVTRALRAWDANFPSGSLPLRFLENHDEPRATAIFGRERLPAYATVAMLSGGLPLIYTGQEIGAIHRPSLFEAEPIDWAPGNTAVTDLYRGLLRLQKSGDPWGPGSAKAVETDRPETVVAFQRRGANRRGLVVANLGRDRETVRVGRLVGGGSFARVDGSNAGSLETVATGVPLVLESGAAWIGEAVR